jgi:GEVED domain/Secretion system C-terminal sorting domain/Pregnancy-associated plasma protein-A
MKSVKHTFLLFLACICFTITSAQNQCGFDYKRQKQLEDPNFIELERLAEQKIKNATLNSNFSARATAGTVLTIPVVVHVLHLGESVGTGTNISDAQIQSSIDNLNDYYRGQIPTSPVDFEIEFTLAKRDPSCNATTGINRMDASTLPGYSNYGVNVNNTNGASYEDIVALSSWPKNDYFNIWIVTELDGNNGGYGFQGYAYFYNDNALNHGSVMMSTVFGYDPGNTNGWGLNSNGDNSTVVHEVGHFFNLFHTFQGDGTGNTCPLDETVGTDSDGCADTVPHKRETSTCPSTNDCTGSPWVDNNTVNNIMSYYYCSDRLTNDQKTRARVSMEGTTIVSSIGSVPIDTNFVAPMSVCSTNTADANNYAGIMSVELSGISNASSTNGNDGGNIDGIAGCSNTYEIDTSISNTLNVEVGPNLNQLGVWIDWNNDGDFDDDSEQQYLVSGGILENSITHIVLDYPTIIPYDNYVRIRIINDLDSVYGGVSAISDACYNSLVYGQSEDYTIYVMPGGATTYTYNNGWLPNSPVGASTSADTIIIDAGTANISASTDCNTITVNPGAALTIDSGVTLTTTTIDLNSTSQLFSSLKSDGTITGVVNYNRYTSQIGTNDLISAPVSGQQFTAFAALNANLAASATTIRAFAPYNTAAGAYQNYDLITNALTTIDSGIGYRAATTDGSTLMFTGTVRTDDVLDIPISDAAAGFAWNLIGNPYPSYLDFDTFFTTNANEFDSGSAYQAIYGYDGNASNGWTVWNLATIADGTVTELIAPGQAFFVKAKSGGGLVDFTTGMRTTGTSDDFIAGRNSTTNVALCKLNLISATNNASTQIYFIEGTTRGLDIGYDAGSYLGSAADYSIYSNLVEDNLGLDMAIQSLPYDDFNSIIVPLGIKAQPNEALTISIDDLSSLPSNTYVYLDDTVENTLTLLNTNDYTFMPVSELNGVGRFYLRFSSDALSTIKNELNDIQIYTNAIPKEIVIQGLLTNKTEAHIYDIQGRLVMRQDLDLTNTSNRISVSNLSTGIYIVKVSSINKVETKKLIIN